jgi:membrane protein YqaA with SNARE-associated domain
MENQPNLKKSDSNSLNSTSITEKPLSAAEAKKVEEEKKKGFMAKWGGAILLTSVVVLFVALAVSNINFGAWLALTALWFNDNLGWFGIYIGVFVISTFGNFTVIFPVPYTVSLVVISIIVPGVNPAILAIFAALGAGIGETSAYFIGRGLTEVFGESESTKRFKGYIDKGWAPLLIFIFAATPLPDDAFLIVLGYTKYSLKKTLFWVTIGKWVLCFLMAAIPTWIMAASPSVGNWLLGLFGIDFAEIQALGVGAISASTPAEMITSTITWIIAISAMFAMVYVDWGKVVKKFSKNKQSKEYHPNDVLNNNTTNSNTKNNNTNNLNSKNNNTNNSNIAP